MRGARTYGALARSPSLGVLGERGGRDPLASLYNGLVAYWTLNEASGTRFDSVGSNDLSDTNGVGSVSGVQGNAASLDAGIGQFLSVSGAGIAATMTDEATINMWVKRTQNAPTTSENSTFVSVGEGGDGIDHYPYTNGNDYIGIFRSDRLSLGTVLDGVPDRTVWHMLTITTTPGANGYKIYQNGVLEYETSGEATVKIPSTIKFGQGSINPDRFYDGNFDEIAMYNRALPPAQIALLYNGGTPPKLF